MMKWGSVMDASDVWTIYKIFGMAWYIGTYGDLLVP